MNQIATACCELVVAGVVIFNLSTYCRFPSLHFPAVNPFTCRGWRGELPEWEREEKEKRKTLKEKRARNDEAVPVATWERHCLAASLLSHDRQEVRKGEGQGLLKPIPSPFPPQELNANNTAFIQSNTESHQKIIRTALVPDTQEAKNRTPAQQKAEESTMCARVHAPVVIFPF